MDLHTIELFAGVGMLGEGLRSGLAHMGRTTRTVCYVEREAYAASVLASRMQEGSLDEAPIWSDVTTFNGKQFRGAVDCVIGGFPCQDLSLAGRRAGLDGKRSGLFFEICRIADDCGARYLFLENVAGISSATATVVDEAEGELEERAAARVLGELADRGWNAEWVTLSAASVGASHGRERWFCWAWREVGHARRNARSPEYRQQPNGASGGAGESGKAGGIKQMDNTGRVQRCAGHEQDQPGCTKAGEHEAHDRAADRGDVLDDTECTQRRAGSVCRTGSQQWNEGGWPETHCGAGEPNEALGHTRLQHQHVQQREDGAEHPGAGEQLADSSGPRLQGSELSGARSGNRWGEEAHGSTEQLCRPLFAPGPADHAWPGIIQQWPNLAPALEPGFYRVVDGLAHRMDDCRAQRLKCCGNGVVALQAATAACILIARSV